MGPKDICDVEEVVGMPVEDCMGIIWIHAFQCYRDAACSKTNLPLDLTESDKRDPNFSTNQLALGVGCS